MPSWHRVTIPSRAGDECSTVQQPTQRETAMITKISAVVIAVILGLSSVASAATLHKPARHHSPRSVSTLVNFQSNWDVSY
jgi:hypothetical protein